MPKISLDLELNTKPVEQGIKEAEGYIRDSKKRLKSDAGVEFTMNLAKLRLDLEKVNRELKQAIKDGEPSRIIKLKVDQEALKKEITIANRSLNNFINTWNENYSALSRLFDWVSKTWGKLTGILAGVSPAAWAVASSFGWMSAAAGITWAAVGWMAIWLKKASDIARSFEDAFTWVSKTVDGTPEQLAALRQELINMSKEIPVTFEQLSSIAAVGGSLWVPIEQMGKFTDTVAKLWVAVDGISAEEAATLLAKIGTVTGEGVGNIDKMGSVVVALGNKMAATEWQILDFTNRIATSAETLGVGSAEIFALSATLTSLGLTAERGAGWVNDVIRNIAVAATKGNEQLKDIAAVSNMSSKEFQKAWKDDAYGALIKFSEWLSESGNKYENMVDIFGGNQWALEVMGKLGKAEGLALLNDALKTSRHEMNLTKGEVSALNAEAEKRFDTMSSQATIMSNKWRAAFEPTGTMLNDTILKPLFKAAGDIAWKVSFMLWLITIWFNTFTMGMYFVWQYIAAFVVSATEYIKGFGESFVSVWTFISRSTDVIFIAFLKVLWLKLSSIGNMMGDLANNTKTIFGTLAENIGIAFWNIWPLIWEAMNGALRAIASWVNSAIWLVNDFTDALKSVPMIGEKLAGLTKIWTVSAWSVNFWAVKSFKAIPELLKIDGWKAWEIAQTWWDAYAKIWAMQLKEMPKWIDPTSLFDSKKLDWKMNDYNASLKKFADWQALAKAKAATAEDAQRWKIKSWIQSEIDTGKKKKEGWGGWDSEAEKARKKELKEIEKSENMKRDMYEKTSDKNDSAHKSAVDKIIDHEKAIIKLWEEYKKMAEDAGESLRDLWNELNELTSEKKQNEQETFNELAKKRVELLKDQKELEKDIAAAIKEGWDQEAWDKIAEDQQKLVGIKSEILAIEKATPKSTLDEVARVESLTIAEKAMLELKEKQLEVDKKIETNRQKRMVDESILNGGKILISGQWDNAKAQIKDAQGIVTDLTDFAAQEYAIDTANRQAEIDNKVAIERAGIDEQLLALQNLDVERRAIDVSYSEFFKSELQGRIDKTRELIRVLQEAASLAGWAWVSSQQNAILKDVTKNATRTVNITNNINNWVDVESVNRANTKWL